MSFVFKGINSNSGYGGYEYTDILLYNLKWFIDWGLLHTGAFDIFESMSGEGDDSFFAEDENILRPALDARYQDNRIYEGVGREWVWESGVQLPSGFATPFRVSGVTIDDTFHPISEEGVFSHHIDYQNGRVIFNNIQDADSTIKANYVARSVHVGFADDPEFMVLMKDAVEDFLTNTLPSGTAPRDHQIWMPSIFLELQEGEQRGLQLGGGQIKTETIILHIFADKPSDRNTLKDMMFKQTRKVFNIADLNDITFPFDQFGDIVSGVTNWPDLVNDNTFKKIRIVDGKARNINSLNSKIFRARVEWTIEIDFGNI